MTNMFVGTYTDPANLYAPTTVHGVNLTYLAQRASSAWPLYISRSAGIIASILLILLLLITVGEVTGFTYKFVEPLISWSLQRAVAIAFGVSFVVHAVAFAFDKFAPFNFYHDLVPFSSETVSQVNTYGYDSAYLVLGVVASYVASILLVSSVIRVNRNDLRGQILRILVYPVIVILFFHQLYFSNHVLHGGARTIWWVIGLILIVGSLYPLLRTRTIHKTE